MPPGAAKRSAWTWGTSTRPNRSPTNSPRSLVQNGRILLHVSRGVRWDSDHVIVLNDDLLNLGREIAACGTDRIEIGLDYFDATINRVGAWVIGTHNMRKALLCGFLTQVLESCVPVTRLTLAIRN